MPRGNPSWTSNFNRFWIDFGSQLVTPEPTKSLKSHWFYKHFLLCGIFKIRSNFDPILVQTWMDFGFENPPKSALGRLLGRLVAVLGCLWPSWKALETCRWDIENGCFEKAEKKSTKNAPAAVCGQFLDFLWG